MSYIVITESEELDLKSKKIKRKTYNKINEVWESLTITERIFVFEFLGVIYPNKIRTLNEGTWWNTLADIIGIFDPTGVVDILNGISYWRQGEKLFAMLSWIAAVPGLGDLIAKPIIGTLKMGTPATKAFKAAVDSGNAAKVAETAQKVGPAATKLVTQSVTWGDRIVNVLKKTVGRIPIGLPFLAGGSRLSGKGFVRVVEEWVDMFKSASPKMFKGYKPVGRTFGEKYISGGLAPRLFGNKATRSLMLRTKAYLGFLDYLGIGNWDNDPMTPEELMKKYPDIEARWEDYSKTDEGRKNIEDEEKSQPDNLRPPGFSDEEWKTAQQLNPMSKSGGFDIGGVFGKDANPITSLFKHMLA